MVKIHSYKTQNKPSSKVTFEISFVFITKFTFKPNKLHHRNKVFLITNKKKKPSRTPWNAASHPWFGNPALDTFSPCCELLFLLVKNVSLRIKKMFSTIKMYGTLTHN